MPTDVLFQRTLPHGPVVRIRRTSGAGVVPIAVVLEVDRRAGTARAELGIPPALVESAAPSEREALRALEPLARDDAAVARLMRERGLR